MRRAPRQLSRPGEARRAPSIIRPTMGPSAISRPTLAARAGDGGAGATWCERTVVLPSAGSAVSIGTGEPLSTTITSYSSPSMPR